MLTTDTYATGLELTKGLLPTVIDYGTHKGPFHAHDAAGLLDELVRLSSLHEGIRAFAMGAYLVGDYPPGHPYWDLQAKRVDIFVAATIEALT